MQLAKVFIATITCLLLSSCAFMQGLRAQEKNVTESGKEISVSGGAPQASQGNATSANETAASTISPVTR